jgi:hypothetical protein
LCWKPLFSLTIWIWKKHVEYWTCWSLPGAEEWAPWLSTAIFDLLYLTSSEETDAPHLYYGSSIVLIELQIGDRSLKQHRDQHWTKSKVLHEATVWDKTLLSYVSVALPSSFKLDNLTLAAALPIQVCWGLPNI